MDEAEHDVLAYMTFPVQHRVKLHSTNPLERLNKEVKRRADVVGIYSFPSPVLFSRILGRAMRTRCKPVVRTNDGSRNRHSRIL